MDAQYLNLPCDPETQEARLYGTAVRQIVERASTRR